MSFLNDIIRGEKQKELEEELAKKKKELKTESKPVDHQKEMINITNGFQKQVKLFGKTTQVSRLQEIYEFIKINQSNLIDAISWSINTIKNKREVKSEDLNTQYYRNFVKWNELRDFLRKI